MSRIFISYRRSDSAVAARKLYQRLSRPFGASEVGFDKQFAAGVDFEEAIQHEVGSCDVLIAVIGKDWLRCADEAGRRRLDKENDHVRSEILAALERGVLVVPVLVDDAGMPERMHLSPALDELAKRNAVTADAEGVKKLIKDIESVLGKSGPKANAAKAGVSPRAAPATAIAGTVAYLFAGHAIGAGRTSTAWMTWKTSVTSSRCRRAAWFREWEACRDRTSVTIRLGRTIRVRERSLESTGRRAWQPDRIRAAGARRRLTPKSKGRRFSRELR